MKKRNKRLLLKKYKQKQDLNFIKSLKETTINISKRDFYFLSFWFLILLFYVLIAVPVFFLVYFDSENAAAFLLPLVSDSYKGYVPFAFLGFLSMAAGGFLTVEPLFGERKTINFLLIYFGRAFTYPLILSLYKAGRIPSAQIFAIPVFSIGIAVTALIMGAFYLKCFVEDYKFGLQNANFE